MRFAARFIRRDDFDGKGPLEIKWNFQPPTCLRPCPIWFRFKHRATNMIRDIIRKKMLVKTRWLCFNLCDKSNRVECAIWLTYLLEILRRVQGGLHSHVLFFMWPSLRSTWPQERIGLVLLAHCFSRLWIFPVQKRKTGKQMHLAFGYF